MRVGYLGVGDLSKDVVFNVDSKVIETITNMKVTKQATYTTHKIHGDKAIPEMTGIEAGTITFDIVLSAFLGVNPQKELDKLEAFMKAGTICNLVLGNKLCGRWVIKQMPYNVDYTYKDGEVSQATVSVSLIEAGG